MTKYIAISIGAILGANARYLAQQWVAARGLAGFPWGTLIVNLTGTLILSFFLTLTTERILADPNSRFLIAVGFCGSYTTFSSLMYESFSLFETAGWWPGLLNLTGSTLLGVLGTVVGVILARLL